MNDEENADYDFDNALVCRWMNGQAAITPRISKYYMNKDKEDIIGCTPPNPCRHFVGRQKEIETIHNAFSSNSKVFLHGVAGMGKSEVAKAFAKYCKKEYINQIYILYSGNLKKDIADLDFVNDRYGTSVDELFYTA